MRLHYCFLICLVLLSFSCSLKEQHSTIKTVKITPTKTAELEDTFDSVRIVALDQNEESLFSWQGFNVVKFAYNKIYISPSSYRNNKLFIYDLKGQLVQIVDKFGPGPDELKRALAFNIVDEEHLDLMSHQSKRLYRFNLPMDSILWSKKFDFDLGLNFLEAPEHDGYYFTRMLRVANQVDPVYWLFKADSKMEETANFIKGKFFKDAPFYVPGVIHNIDLVRDSLRMIPPYSDTIYSVVKGKEIPTYKLDFGAYKRYNSNNVTGELVDDVFKNRNGVKAIEFHETDTKLVVNYDYRRSNFTIYDKRTDKTQNLYASYAMPDGVSYYVFSVIDVDEEKIVCKLTLGGISLQDFVEDAFPLRGVSGLSPSEFDAEDNQEAPLLAIFYFKK